MNLPLPLQVEYLDTLAEKMADHSAFDPGRFRDAARALTLAQGVPATDAQVTAAIEDVVARRGLALQPSAPPALTPLAWNRPRNGSELALAKAALQQQSQTLAPKAGLPDMPMLVMVLGGSSLPILVGHWALSQFGSVGLAVGSALLTGSLIVAWGVRSLRSRLQANQQLDLLQREQKELESAQATEAQMDQWEHVPEAAAYARACMKSELGLLAGDLTRLDQVTRIAMNAHEAARLARRTARFLEAGAPA